MGCKISEWIWVTMCDNVRSVSPELAVRLSGRGGAAGPATAITGNISLSSTCHATPISANSNTDTLLYFFICYKHILSPNLNGFEGSEDFQDYACRGGLRRSLNGHNAWCMVTPWPWRSSHCSQLLDLEIFPKFEVWQWCDWTRTTDSDSESETR